MNAPTSFFVTGTDTGVGKTHVSSALLLAIRRRALKAYGYKPVASGCERRGEEWISDDAEKLRAYSTTPTPDLALMNPIALPEPIAPHLAAAHVGREIALPPLHEATKWDYLQRAAYARVNTFEPAGAGPARPVPGASRPLRTTTERERG